MKPFEYIEPHSVEEALLFLNQFGNETKILAGGTILLLQMKSQKITPRYVVNIMNISGLDRIEYNEKEGMTIGSLATIANLEDSFILRDRLSILHQAARELGTQQIKNIATLGGNLCNASPAAEMAPALIALGASAKLVSLSGERVVKLEDFFVGPGKSVLKTGEMLIEVQVPHPPPGSKGIYLKHAFRKKLEMANVGIAVLADFNEKEKFIKDVLIVLGAVASIPKRALEAEALAKGKKMDGELLERVALLASEESSPIDEVWASAEYKREMVKVFVERAFDQILSLDGYRV